jgi:hypothetical protein
MACDSGVFTMFSCSPNEYANTTSNGGIFTTNLIAAAQQWTMTGYQVPRVLRVDEAFEEADHSTRKLEPSQTPEQDTTVDGKQFPFGVIAP